MLCAKYPFAGCQLLTQLVPQNLNLFRHNHTIRVTEKYLLYPSPISVLSVAELF